MDPLIWSALISIAPQVLSWVFGSGGEEEEDQLTQTTTTETTPQGFQDPLRGVLGPAMTAQLIGNWDLMKGAGMPGGKGGTGFGGDMFGDIIKLLQDEWPTIIEGYGEGGEGKKSCQECEDAYKKAKEKGQVSSKDYDAYVKCHKNCTASSPHGEKK